MPQKRKFDREHSGSKEETLKEMHPNKKLKDVLVAEPDIICIPCMKDGGDHMEISDEQDESQPNEHWVMFNRKVLNHYG